MFEAIAAAAGGDELGEDRCAVDRDAATEDDVEILERDRETVRMLEAAEADLTALVVLKCPHSGTQDRRPQRSVVRSGVST